MFVREDFKCKCCGQSHIDGRIVSIVNALNNELGRTLNKNSIRSGFRCEKHNAEVGGVHDSAHTKGLACDIEVKSGWQRYVIIKTLLQFDVLRIGIVGYEDFVHFDLDDSKPLPVIF